MKTQFATTTTWIKRLLGVVSLGVSLLAHVGCNTTEGVGEDIEDLGDSIDAAAEDAND